MTPGQLHLATCLVDLPRRLVTRADGQAQLTRIEGDLLAYLAARPNRDVPRQELLDEVWGYHHRA